MNFREKKIAAKELGKFAEDIAANEYIKRGYAILERNWRLGKTEIDLIAQKDDTIVISEVKARKNSEEDALAAVTPDKRKRMIRAADFYLRQLPVAYNYRFDIVAFGGNIENFEFEIFEDAFLAADIF